MEEHDDGADGDEGVGDIECWPVVVTPVEVQEVDDGALGDAVDEVADGTAEDAGERDQEKLLPGVDAAYEVDECGEGRYRDDGEERDAEPIRLVGEDREGGTAVAHVGDVEERVDDRDGVV